MDFYASMYMPAPRNALAVRGAPLRLLRWPVLEAGPESAACSPLSHLACPYDFTTTIQHSSHFGCLPVLIASITCPFHISRFADSSEPWTPSRKSSSASPPRSPRFTPPPHRHPLPLAPLPRDARSAPANQRLPLLRLPARRFRNHSMASSRLLNPYTPRLWLQGLLLPQHPSLWLKPNLPFHAHRRQWLTVRKKSTMR